MSGVLPTHILDATPRSLSWCGVSPDNGPLGPQNHRWPVAPQAGKTPGMPTKYNRADSRLWLPMLLMQLLLVMLLLQSE